MIVSVEVKTKWVVGTIASVACFSKENPEDHGQMHVIPALPLYGAWASLWRGSTACSAAIFGCFLCDWILKIWKVLGFFPEWSVTLFNQGNHIRIMLWMMYPRWLGLQYVEEHSVSQPCSFWWSRSIPVCGCLQNNYVSVRVTRNFWHFWQLNWVLFSQKYTNCCSLALNTHHCLNWIWEAFFLSVSCQGKILEQFYSWEKRRFFTVTVRQTFVRTI